MVLSLIAACKPARGLVAVMCGYSPRGLMLLCIIYCGVCILWCVLISVKYRLTGCHCLHTQFSMKPCAAFKFPGFQKMPACHECNKGRANGTLRHLAQPQLSSQTATCTARQHISDSLHICSQPHNIAHIFIPAFSCSLLFRRAFLHPHSHI